MTSEKTSIDVYNSRRNTIKAGGQFFPPREATTVDVDESAAAAIAGTPGLSVKGSARDDAKALRHALVTRAKDLGLPAIGKNADLAAAINQAEAAAAAAGRPAEETTATATEPGTGDVTAGEPSDTDSPAG